MNFKEYNKQYDNLAKEIEKVIDQLKKQGNVSPAQISNYVQKKIKHDEKDRDKILSRYLRTLGGVFYSSL